MENKMYLSSCPVCGKALFRGQPNSYIEGGCPKCKKYICVRFTATGFQACISDANSAEQPDRKMIGQA